jgi:hypothetical protein
LFCGALAVVAGQLLTQARVLAVVVGCIINKFSLHLV